MPWKMIDLSPIARPSEQGRERRPAGGDLTSEPNSGAGAWRRRAWRGRARLSGRSQRQLLSPDSLPDNRGCAVGGCQSAPTPTKDEGGRSVGVCQLRGNIRGGQENVGYTVPGRRKRASFPKHRCARNPIAAIWTSVNLTGLGFAKLSAAWSLTHPAALRPRQHHAPVNPPSPLCYLSVRPCQPHGTRTRQELNRAGVMSLSLSWTVRWT